jgi:hypothetical protein
MDEKFIPAVVSIHSDISFERREPYLFIHPLSLTFRKFQGKQVKLREKACMFDSFPYIKEVEERAAYRK